MKALGLLLQKIKNTKKENNSLVLPRRVWDSSSPGSRVSGSQQQHSVWTHAAPAWPFQAPRSQTDRWGYAGCRRNFLKPTEEKTRSHPSHGERTNKQMKRYRNCSLTQKPAHKQNLIPEFHFKQKSNRGDLRWKSGREITLDRKYLKMRKWVNTWSSGL